MENQEFTPKKMNNRSDLDNLVGNRLRELRTRQGLSLRMLASLSGLNINTLSLVENGKTSPSVSTLQQIAIALDVPINTFFESEPVEKQIVFTPRESRPETSFGSALMQNLGLDFSGNTVQPFVVTLQRGQGSGERKIVHTGSELVYCLEGRLQYIVDQQEFELNPGDNLLFEASLPHQWKNPSDADAVFLLTIIPANDREHSGKHHFCLENCQGEQFIKIAVITEDGKSISQHFGRAPFFKVFSIEDGKIIQTEMREKTGHTRSGSEGQQGKDHGMDAASHGKHTQMANAIADCQVLICGGMGRGAYESMRRLNIQPIVTDLNDIEEAVQTYLTGSLVDHTEKLH